MDGTEQHIPSPASSAPISVVCVNISVDSVDGVDSNAGNVSYSVVAKSSPNSAVRVDGY